MTKSLVPALLLFAAAAIGLLALRDAITASAPAANTAPVASRETERASYEGRTARLTKSGDGHYWATANVNGVPTRFLVDTGASVVALTLRDARRVGLNVDALPRNIQIATANGKIAAASTTLASIKIDRVEVEGVRAVVVEHGLEQSLLGMSFLNALHDWKATDGALEIRQ